MSEVKKVITVDGEPPVEAKAPKKKATRSKKPAGPRPKVELHASDESIKVEVTNAEVLRGAGYEVLDSYEFPLDDPEASVKAHRVLAKVRAAIAEFAPPVAGKVRTKSDLTRRVVTAGEKRSNMFIYGPTGSGKTKAVLDGMAALVKLGELDVYYKVPMSPGVEDVDLVTRLVPGPGGIEQRRGALRAIYEEAAEKKVGLLLDEVNRATARALNIILTAIDPVEGQYVLYDFVTDEELVVPLENLFIVATANLGGAYSGTNSMDEALLDRFPRTLYWGYDSKLEKALVKGPGARNLHKAAATLRDLYRSGELRSPFSTRHLVGWASTLASFEDLDHAVEAAKDTFVYRLASVDSYGFPDEAEVELIIEAIRESWTAKEGS